MFQPSRWTDNAELTSLVDASDPLGYKNFEGRDETVSIETYTFFIVTWSTIKSD
jgi:hypothetical protein